MKKIYILSFIKSSSIFDTMRNTLLFTQCRGPFLRNTEWRNIAGPWSRDKQNKCYDLPSSHGSRLMVEPFKFVSLELGIEGPSSIRRRVHFWPPCLEFGRRARTEAGSMACRRGCMTGRQAQTMPMLHSTLIQMARWVIVPGNRVSDSGQSIIIGTTPVLTCQVCLLEFFDEEGPENACNTCAIIMAMSEKKAKKYAELGHDLDLQRANGKCPDQS